MRARARHRAVAAGQNDLPMACTSHTPSRPNVHRATVTMPTSPQISIITATLNVGHLLPELIASLRAERTPEIEWIVVDGCSRDGTCDLVRAARDVVDQFRSEPDSGIYDAWNKGVAMARAPWIMFMGADDMFAPGALRRLLDAVAVAGPQVNLIVASGQWVHPQTLEPIRLIDRPWNLSAMQRWMSINHPGTLHHRDLFARHGLFDTTLRIAGDYDFLLRAGPEIRATLVVPPPLVRVRRGGISDSVAALREQRLVRGRHVPLSGWRLDFDYVVAIVKRGVRHLLSDPLLRRLYGAWRWLGH